MYYNSLHCVFVTILLVLSGVHFNHSAGILSKLGLNSLKFVTKLFVSNVNTRMRSTEQNPLNR